MISNCGQDERGKYSGGAAGDQTGSEWQIIPWYNRPWNCVLRHPDQRVQADLAYLGRAAAENNNVGYDQGQRTTYWTQLVIASYDPAKIKTKCEADCSSGVAANVKAAGYRLEIKKLQEVSKDCYTGNLRAALKAAGFGVLTASKYLTSDKYLIPGDILLYEGHHTATNLDYGSLAAPKEPEKKPGWQHTDIGWWYMYENGSYPSNKWELINHHWYLFNRDGYMVTGWHRWDGKTCDPDDGSGDWYFLDNTKNGPLEGACWHSRENGIMEVWWIK